MLVLRVLTSWGWPGPVSWLALQDRRVVLGGSELSDRLDLVETRWEEEVITITRLLSSQLRGEGDWSRCQHREGAG